jgi:hypothetical protein
MRGQMRDRWPGQRAGTNQKHCHTRESAHRRDTAREPKRGQRIIEHGALRPGRCKLETPSRVDMTGGNWLHQNQSESGTTNSKTTTHIGPYTHHPAPFLSGQFVDIEPMHRTRHHPERRRNVFLRSRRRTYWHEASEQSSRLSHPPSRVSPRPTAQRNTNLNATQ